MSLKKPADARREGRMGIRVRPAASGLLLAEALERTVVIETRAALIAYLQEHYDFWSPTEENVTVEKYGEGIDERCGWETHLVCVDGKAALFADGCPE